MKWFFGMLAFAFFLAGCHPKMSDTQKEGGNIEVFGSPLKNAELMSFQEVEDKLENADTIVTKLEGTVNEVCQVKGCWMTLVSGEIGSPQFTVRFKDYGFFVPKDISGSRVVIEGKAYKELTSVEDLKHYAIDAGMSQAKVDEITKPKMDYIFLANGVELYSNR